MSREWPQLRAVTSAALLADFAVAQGAPLDRILHGTGISGPALGTPHAEITAGQELALLTNLVAELGDVPGLGLLAGTRYHATTHGVWGFAVISSPDVGSALDVAIRYADLCFSFSRIYADYSGTHARIVYDDSRVPGPIRRFHLERDLAATLTVQLDLMPVRLAVRRIDLTLPPHPVYTEFAAETGAELVFGQRETAITVDRSVLTLPLPQANPHTAWQCEQQCAALLSRRRERLGTSGQVRDLLLRRGMLAPQQDVAAGLGLSVRTLRRRLADEGTTFRELSGETFGVLAEELLAAGLTVEQIAGRLGYSSASALTYAFKSWRGVPPGKYGRDRRAPAAALSS